MTPIRAKLLRTHRKQYRIPSHDFIWRFRVATWELSKASLLTDRAGRPIG